ncbi:hypothetical protein FGO68_gene8606 [Halteria grandinella]|uniref:Uncharacterized protein n=1 Tax=Halteria grandinella TaxID=5974 RepID=A0A8J8NFW5_HALGN|nr:hypothetical protein FGO68_gene8606 [Halteria grandinella]
MGAAMEEARRLLYEKVIKKFTLQDITKHKTLRQKNLVEMLTGYPNHGVGFKVYNKHWPQGSFYHVKQVDLNAPRYGSLYGVYYQDGQIAGNKIEKVAQVLKRGLWSYDLKDPAFTEPQITLDNDLTINMVRTQQLIEEKKEFLAKRTKSMTWVGEPEEQEWKKKKAAPVKAAKGRAAPKKK